MQRGSCSRGRILGGWLWRGEVPALSAPSDLLRTLWTKVLEIDQNGRGLGKAGNGLWWSVSSSRCQTAGGSGALRAISVGNRDIL
jgi:hypothetical protein